VRENPDALDVLVFLNPLELTAGYDPPARPARSKRSPALAAVLYDLIPLLFPDGYLRRWPSVTMARRYHWTLERLRQYDRLLVISEATRDDVIRLLNVPPWRVVNIGAGGDGPDSFGAAATAEEPGDLARIEALGLAEPFLFALSARDPRKNLDGLLAAYSRLTDVLKQTHRLAIAAGIGAADPEAAAIWKKAEALGIRGNVSLTGWVDDATLRALYRRCAAFVFPSLYEGFGLPILEAMRCGAVVLAGDNSSQPEVAGDAALLVNTADPDALAGAIERALTDLALARTLRARGPVRATRFTWEAVARRALEALAAPAPCAGPGRVKHTRPGRVQPRIAVFSPVAPHPSGVANYAHNLIESLNAHFAIDLFHDTGEWPFARFQSRDVGCYDHRVFSRLNRLRPYRAVLYQLGNSPAHSFAFEALQAHPGIVTLHDLALASFHYERAIRSGGKPAFREALEATHRGRASEYAHLLAQFETDPRAMVAGLTAQGFDMNRSIVGAARAVIVHSRYGAARLECPLGAREAPKLVVIPHGAEAAPTVSPAARARLRAHLKLPVDGLFVGRFGVVHPAKLDVPVLAAFAEVARIVPNATLLVVGEEADGGLARRATEALGLTARVRFWGRPDDGCFDSLMQVTDVALALRRPPTNGETSGALLHLLRFGIPTIVTDVGSFAEFPDHVVRKVPWADDASGQDRLQQALLELATRPGMRTALAEAARATVQTEHSWERIARLYADVIIAMNSRRHDSLPRPHFGMRDRLRRQSQERTTR
jgi:glycosyltransferase involved in cell wall biosynthesis